MLIDLPLLCSSTLVFSLTNPSNDSAVPTASLVTAVTTLDSSSPLTKSWSSRKAKLLPALLGPTSTITSRGSVLTVVPSEKVMLSNVRRSLSLGCWIRESCSIVPSIAIADKLASFFLIYPLPNKRAFLCRSHRATRPALRMRSTNYLNNNPCTKSLSRVFGAVCPCGSGVSGRGYRKRRCWVEDLEGLGGSD